MRSEKPVYDIESGQRRFWRVALVVGHEPVPQVWDGDSSTHWP